MLFVLRVWSSGLPHVSLYHIWPSVSVLGIPVLLFRNLCLMCLTFSFPFLVLYPRFVPAVFPGVSDLPYYLVFIYNPSSPFALPHVVPQCSAPPSPVFHDISDILVSYCANIFTFSIPSLEFIFCIWVQIPPVTQPYVTQSHCSDAFLHHVLHLYFWQKLNWLSDFTNQTRLKAYPRFLRHQIMSTYLLLLLPQNVLKNKNKTNALTLKTALNHVNWSLGYLNSKMMCVNTDQHLRCREEASRGRCSWPVWQKADRARTPPRPERQKTSWKNPRSNLKCLSSCNSPLAIREVQHRWKSNTLPFWYNDRSRVACQIHARFSKQLWLFLMNPQWGHRLIPVYSKSLGNDCESPHGFWIS